MGDKLPLACGAGAAAVVERLAARQQQLAAEREQRQAQLQADADSREDVQGFLTSYQADYTQLQGRCEDLTAAAAGPTVQQDGAHKAALLEQLEALSLDVSNKEHSVSAASYFLPPYELRTCTSQLQQLRLQLADAKQQLQPKRKFAFSKAVARTNISTTAAAAASSAQHQQQQGAHADPSTAGAPPGAAGNESTPAQAAATTASTPPPALSPQDQQLIAAGHGFAGLSGQLLVPSAQQLAGQGFVLHQLSNCTVFLLGRLSALRLQHLQDCRVYTGPVVGATFVDSCKSCTLMLASYQVRIHSAEACQFYLRVRSRPIIEHSSSLSFAPYAAEALLCRQGAAAAGRGSSGDAANGTQQQQEHQQQEQQQQHEQEQEQQQEEPHQQEPQGRQQQQQHQGDRPPPDWHPTEVLQAAQLSEDTGLWQQVDDFGWVKASASPHWRVLPEQDRKAVPDRLPQLS